MTATVGGRQVRMPTPFQKRRSFLEKLPVLRAAQEQLDGIANAQYSVGGSVSWQTASDWDGAASENGVVHESVANSDHSDDTIVKQGYSAASPFNSARRFYPFHEDSGSTAYDFGSDGSNGSISGASLGASGLLGTTSFDFDGSDDYVEIPNFFQSPITLIQYIQTNDTSTVQQPYRGSDGGDWGTTISISSGNFRHHVNNGSSTQTLTASIPNTTDLHQVVGWFDGSTQKLFLNGTEMKSSSFSGPLSYSSGKTFIGATSPGSNTHNGRIAGTWLYDSAISTSLISDHYDIVSNAGELVSGWKNLNAAANSLVTTSTIPASSSVTVVVEQDVGSDGTVDNSQSVSLAGGSDESNGLTGFSSNDGRYRVRVQPDNSDINVTAQLNKATVSA